MRSHQTALSDCQCGCGEPATTWHAGYAAACYYRWYRAGKPDTGPPPPRRGRAAADARHEDITWLTEAGTSRHEIAQRLNITIATVERHLSPPAAPMECVVNGCKSDAAWRRWCQTHRNPQQVYNAARTAGMNRQQAAQHTGVTPLSTYRWEPGEPGQGRPRKQTAA